MSPPYVNSGVPVFVGRRIQRGRGLGGIFHSLAKSFLMPAIKNIGTSLIKTGLSKAANAIEDIGQGKSVKTALKDQFIGDNTPTTIMRAGAKRAAHFLNEVADNNSKPVKRLNNKRQRRRRKHDVFDKL